MKTIPKKRKSIGKLLEDTFPTLVCSCNATVIGDKLYMPLSEQNDQRLLEIRFVSTKENYRHYTALTLTLTHKEFGKINENFTLMSNIFSPDQDDDDYEEEQDNPFVEFDGHFYKWSRELTADEKLGLHKFVTAYVTKWR